MKSNDYEINAMTIKCEFCNGTGKDEDAKDCGWCWGTGSKAAQMRMTPPDEAATPDRVTTAEPAGQAQRHTIAHLRYAGGEEHNVKYVSEVDYDRVVAERDALMAKPSQQHQGEPVAWMVRREDGSLEGIHDTPRDMAHASYYQMTVIPLYIRADPGETERYTGELKKLRVDSASLAGTVDGLRTQLAERDALLLNVVEACEYGQHLDTIKEIALSASAEPSAPKPVSDSVVRCSFCDAESVSGSPWVGGGHTEDGRLIYRAWGCKNHHAAATAALFALAHNDLVITSDDRLMKPIVAPVECDERSFDALRKDAERYRWLIDNEINAYIGVCDWSKNSYEPTNLFGEQASKAIDEEMARAALERKQ